jgi:integrase
VARRPVPEPRRLLDLKVFAPAVVKAKLSAGTSTYSLRHAYASWLLTAGESVIAVAERLGEPVEGATNASPMTSPDVVKVSGS